jgi:hypothetical protein
LWWLHLPRGGRNFAPVCQKNKDCYSFLWAPSICFDPGSNVHCGMTLTEILLSELCWQYVICMRCKKEPCNNQFNRIICTIYEVLLWCEMSCRNSWDVKKPGRNKYSIRW